MSDSAVPTPSEKPVSKRRTPPAWPPTPSEKPMCKHGFDRWHDFEIYDGGQTPGESPDFRGRCPGPVIATEPETPVPEVADEDDEIASSFTAFVKQQFGEAFEFANGDPKCSPFYKSFAAGFLARRKPDPTLREQP